MISILRQRTVKHLLQKLVKVKSSTLSSPKRSELYFGYGANLSVKRFHDRKMNVQEVGNAVLRNHEIKFSLSNEYMNKGYAGVHEKEGSEVWGVLYEFDLLSIKLLDALEWCGFGAYERKKVKVCLTNGDEKYCWCYFVKSPKFDLVPSKIYLNNIIKAAQERKFPESYSDFLRDHEFKDNFKIDYGFSLLFYGKRRLFEHQLKSIYKTHDKLREKICDII